MGGRPGLQNLCLSDPERAPYAIFLHSSLADARILSGTCKHLNTISWKFVFHVRGALPRCHWCPLKGILRHRTLDFGFPYDQFDSNVPVRPPFEAFAPSARANLLTAADFFHHVSKQMETLTLWGPHHASALERGVSFGEVEAG